MQFKLILFKGQLFIKKASYKVLHFAFLPAASESSCSASLSAFCIGIIGIIAI